VSKSALPFEKGVEMKERGEGMTLSMWRWTVVIGAVSLVMTTVMLLAK
jgi:hypothetical protein